MIKNLCVLLMLTLTPFTWAEDKTATPPAAPKIASAGTSNVNTGINSGDGSALHSIAAPLIVTTVLTSTFLIAGGALENRKSTSSNKNKSTTGTVP